MIDVIRAVVREELAARRVTEVGVVTGQFPHAEGDEHNYECAVRLRDSALELPRVPVATQRVGQAAIPNVDDLVLVGFVGGDLHAPVIVGRLYDDTDRPPVADVAEWVYVSPDDAQSGVRRVHMEFPNGNTLTLDDDTVLVDAGGTTITITNGGDVEIASQDRVVVTAAGAVEVSSDGDMTLEAAGALALRAQGDVKIEGLSAALKAQTTAQLEGGASTTVKGPMVSLAGTTTFSPG